MQGTQVPVASFKMPEGANWNYIPVPMLQVGIGLPLGSELKVRYLPKINLGSNGDISLWGVGLMHSIMQYIPSNKVLPLDVSVFGGYTKMTANGPISLQPGDQIITLHLLIFHQPFWQKIHGIIRS